MTDLQDRNFEGSFQLVQGGSCQAAAAASDEAQGRGVAGGEVLASPGQQHLQVTKYHSRSATHEADGALTQTDMFPNEWHGWVGDGSVPWLALAESKSLMCSRDVTLHVARSAPKHMTWNHPVHAL